MTLDETILHCQEIAAAKCDECGKEHAQLVEWLMELAIYRGHIKREFKLDYDIASDIEKGIYTEGIYSIYSKYKYEGSEIFNMLMAMADYKNRRILKAEFKYNMKRLDVAECREQIARYKDALKTANDQSELKHLIIERLKTENEELREYCEVLEKENTELKNGQKIDK